MSTSSKQVPINTEAIDFVLGSLCKNGSDTNMLRNQMILMLAELLRTGDLDGKGAWTDSDLLRSVLALILDYISAPVPESVQSQGYYAQEHYRIVISSYSQNLFIAFSVVTLCWCAVLSSYCWIAGPWT